LKIGTYTILRENTFNGDSKQQAYYSKIFVFLHCVHLYPVYFVSEIVQSEKKISMWRQWEYDFEGIRDADNNDGNIVAEATLDQPPKPVLINRP
jgi:hypothetical protein